MRIIMIHLNFENLKKTTQEWNQKKNTCGFGASDFGTFSKFEHLF